MPKEKEKKQPSPVPSKVEKLLQILKAKNILDEQEIAELKKLD